MKVKTEPLCGPVLVTTYLHGYVKSAGCPLGPKEETMNDEIKGRSGHPASEIARLENALARATEEIDEKDRFIAQAADINAQLRSEVERQCRTIERAHERAEESVRRAGQQSNMLEILRREKAELETKLTNAMADARAMGNAIDGHLATRAREREAIRRRKFRLEPVLRRTLSGLRAGPGRVDLPVYEFEADRGQPVYIAIRRALPGETTDYYRWDEPKGVQGATLVLPGGVELECYELVPAEPLDVAR